jgi:hypothetical protein
MRQGGGRWHAARSRRSRCPTRDCAKYSEINLHPSRRCHCAGASDLCRKNARTNCGWFSSFACAVLQPSLPRSSPAVGQSDPESMANSSSGAAREIWVRLVKNRPPPFYHTRGITGDLALPLSSCQCVFAVNNARASVTLIRNRRLLLDNALPNFAKGKRVSQLL